MSAKVSEMRTKCGFTCYCN